MNNIKDKYDYVGEYHQGVAIVVKDNKYGAILVGGHEIIPTTYDYISTFKDGYAQAIRNGECMIVNLSGQKCVSSAMEFIEIGEKYDVVRKFYNGLACVCKGDRWGVIDEKGNELIAPQFLYISDFINNVANYKSQKNKWGFITKEGNISDDIFDDLEIDVDGNLITTRALPSFIDTEWINDFDYKKVRLNHDGYVIIQTDAGLIITLPSYVYFAQKVSDEIVCVQNKDGFWGAMTITGQQLFPFEYIALLDFKEGRSLAIDKNKKLNLLFKDGKSIKILDSYTITPDFYIHKSKTSEFLFSKNCLYQRIVNIENEYIVVEVSNLDKVRMDFHGKCFVCYNEQIIYLPDWCLGALSYDHNICYALSAENKWGIVDIEGNTICNPIYDKLEEIDNGLIRAESKNTNLKDSSWKRVKYGLFDVVTQVAIPAEYDEYPIKTDYFYLVCKDYKKYGAIDFKGNLIVKTEYSKIEWLDGYYQIFDEERTGLIKSDGSMILPPKYFKIEIINHGLFKVFTDSNSNTFLICNDEGLISRQYSKLGKINEDGNFSVTYHNWNGLVNSIGQFIISDESNNSILVPEKFIWAENFNNEIVKVWSRDKIDLRVCYYYVDKNFRQVLFVGNKVVYIESEIDRVVYENSERCQSFIFKLDDKYGLLSKEGKVLIEPKYFYLDYYQDNLYIVDEREEYYADGKFGIMDENGSIILPTEYSNLEKEGQYIISRKTFVYQLKDIYGFLIDGYERTYKYGLINYEREIIFEPIFQDIIGFKKGFFVLKNDKWYIIDNKCFSEKETSYTLIKRIANKFFRVVSNDNYGVLDLYGKERLSPIYKSVGEINNYGVAIIDCSGKLGLVDENYRILINPQYEYISEFKGGRALVEKHIFKQEDYTDMFIRGEIDTKGNFTEISELTESDILNGRVKHIKILSNGYTIYQKDSSNPFFQYCAVVDRDNNIVLPYKYHSIEERSDGLYHVFVKTQGYDGVISVLDQNFNELKVPEKTNATYKNISIPQTHRLTYNKFGDSVYSYEFASDGIVWIYSYNREKIGLATIKGNILIEPCFGKVEPFVNGYAKVNNGYWYDYEDEDVFPKTTYRKFSEGKWGIINSLGELVIPIEYESIEIEESYYKVTKSIPNYFNGCNETYIQVSGHLNKKGELIIRNKNGEYILANKKFDWQEDFNEEGLSKVYYKTKIGFVNNKSQLVVSSRNDGSVSCDFIIPEYFDWGYYNTEKTFIGIKNGKQGVFTYDGIEIIPTEYDLITYPLKNFYICVNQLEYGLFNADGHELLPTKYKQIQFIGHDLFSAQEPDGRFRLFNKKGICVNDVLFDKICLFGDRNKRDYAYNESKEIENALYTIVQKDGLYGAINIMGELVLPIQYKELYSVNRNVFCGDYHYIDSCGRRVSFRGDEFVPIANDYDSAVLLENGFILVKKDRLYGCINRKGDIIIPIQYNDLLCFENLFVAHIYDENAMTIKYGVLNILNEEVLPFNDTYADIKIENGLILYRVGCYWGAFTLYGKLICEPKYSHIQSFNEYLIKVGIDYDYSMNTYWGLISIDGKELLTIDRYNAQYTICDRLSNGFIEYFVNDDLVGYLDITGREVLKPIYTKIGDFIDGYAIVAKTSYYNDCDGHDRKKYIYGVIDNSFKEVIPCVFDKIEYEPKSGLFKTDLGYKTSNGRFIVDIENTRLFINAKYKYCEAFHDGCAIAVQTENNNLRYGLINTKSEDILPPIFQWLKLSENGLYKFKMNEMYGFVDNNGNIVIPNKYHHIGEFEDNLAVVTVKIRENNYRKYNCLYGFIDNNGKEILPPIYEYMGKKSENKVILMKNNIWRIFDIKTMETIMLLNANYVGICKKGLCRFNIGGTFDRFTLKITGGTWGYINTKGQIIISPIYENVLGFSDGIAAVNQNGKWGFINVDGVIIVPCEYEKVQSSFTEGKGELEKDGEIFAFDKSGSLIDSYEQEKEDYYDGGYENDTPSIYDNPYYNDNLDMDQQSIDFWNNL